MQGLKTIFRVADLAETGSLSSKKKISNIYYAWQIFLPNMHGLNLRKIKKVKQFWMLLSK